MLTRYAPNARTIANDRQTDPSKERTAPSDHLWDSAPEPNGGGRRKKNDKTTTVQYHMPKS